MKESTEEVKDSDKSGAAVLSPLNEQEEWAKISEIMASFGNGLFRESVFMSELEKEFDGLGLSLNSSAAPNPVLTSNIGQWLQALGLQEYETAFINSGFDNIDFLNGVLTDSDLIEIGVKDDEHRKKIIDAVANLSKKTIEAYLDPINNNINNITNNNNNNNNKTGDKAMETNLEEKECASTVDDWLKKLDLECYSDIFKKHLYTNMDRVRNIWEVELMTVLEITKTGHRRRILASLPQRNNQPTIQELNADLTQLKNSIQELEGKANAMSTPTAGTGTLRHSHKKSRPAPQPPAPDLQIRDPSQLLVGVPATLTAQWRHRPTDLVTGHLTYLAQYLGSTVVKELRGRESTMKSIQKLKKPHSDLKESPDILLAISYRGVKFLSADTKELVCEHEIRNIHCACQDAEDLTHFAYITKDHSSKSHYCHVFCVQTMDQATEVILTLGQAFEVAYQMALREAPTARGNGHTRSHSANQIVDPDRTVTSQPQATHSRSHSVNGQVTLESAAHHPMSNGHPPTPPAPPKTPVIHSEEHV